jgi:hypothetical protein
MRVTVKFRIGDDLSRFYNDFVGTLIDSVEGVSVEEKDLKVHIDIAELSDELSGKTQINDIKQYMRDNEISYDMEM